MSRFDEILRRDATDRPADSGPDKGPDTGPRRKFLSIWFRCCHAYGRLYRNRAETAYEGRCPRCGSPVRARIGPNGSSRRSFEAHCND